MTKIVAMLGWKYEPKWLLDDMIKNLEPWVDDFAILDCRGRDELWIHEGDYRIALRKLAFEKKADWVFTTSPDERWEDNAKDVIRPLVEGHKDKIIFEFPLRELYKPDEYRTDGIWGEKTRRRLYPLYYNQTMLYKPIQCPNVPKDPDYAIEPVDINIYHLKHIEVENRQLRADVFKKLDPTNRFQGVGYDYLNENYGATFEKVDKRRGYSPEYKRKYIFKVPKKYLKDTYEVGYTDTSV